MTPHFSEEQVEYANLGWLPSAFRIVNGMAASPDASPQLRQSHGDVMLLGLFKEKLAALNPSLPADVLDDVVRQFIAVDKPDLIAENRRLHRLMVDGVTVQYRREDGTIANDIARIIDFDHPERNDWLAINQFTVIENGCHRRPDIVLFVNGLPFAVIELKNIGDENATIENAYNQLQVYKQEIPSLFRTNLLLVISDGLLARVGSLTADFERFMPWRTINGERVNGAIQVEPKGRPELKTLIQGIFEPLRLTNLMRSFVSFMEDGKNIFKVVAGYHQYHAAIHAVTNTVRAVSSTNDRKIGVIWHTQGSGKSLLMAFYAGQLVTHRALQNPTILVITDRNDLDGQLCDTFAKCKDILRQVPVQAEDRQDLKQRLAVASGGVIFTTIQKFSPDAGQETYPLLSDRSNIIVMADEAHRSQYGFDAKLDKDTGEISYGFAKYLRDALPNASFIGFTGTPIEQGDVSTRAVFGDEIDVYDIQRAVEDGATVPIYYESRLVKIELDQEEITKIDDDIESIADVFEDEEREKNKAKWSRVEALVGAEARLEKIAQDIVQHFEDRLSGMDGKGMVVCMSRRICIDLYQQIIKLRPEWHSDDPMKGAVKIVMTGNIAKDPLEWKQYYRDKKYRDDLATRTKDPKDPLKLVIVRDMWLTGFDAPCMHTMYVDKPMRGHGLMQAIARVNRVFKDKPGGLIVDYIGIAQRLKQALSIYSQSDQRHVGISEEDAVAEMMRRYQIVRDMFHGFDYSRGLKGSPADRLTVLAEAFEFVLDMQQRDASAAANEQERKKARRRYIDAVTGLSKAYALAGATNTARQIREEVGFFQTLRAALVKSDPTSARSEKDADLAVQQIVSRAIVSTEIVDILKAAGIQSPNIGILSEDFMTEIENFKRRNLALEALRKLMNDEIKSRAKSNVVETKKFSDRLQEAVLRYHNNAITAAQLLQELIELAKDIRQARARGDEQGLTPEEIAFYDALAENDSAVKLMGDDKLKVIATELVNSVRGNVSVDWFKREPARARLRIEVRKVLKKYGYPPDLEDQAVQTVLKQAEALASSFV